MKSIFKSALLAVSVGMLSGCAAWQGNPPQAASDGMATSQLTDGYSSYRSYLEQLEANGGEDPTPYQQFARPSTPAPRRFTSGSC